MNQVSRIIGVLGVLSASAFAVSGILVNPGFDYGLSGWTKTEVGRASAYSDAGPTSALLVLVAGDLLGSGTATVTQNIGAIPTSRIGSITIKSRCSGPNRPSFSLVYSDGTRQSAFFSAQTDFSTYQTDNLSGLLTPGRNLTKVEVSIADGTTINPTFCYIDEITITSSDGPGTNLIQNPGFEVLSFIGAPNFEANFISWNEGPTSPTIIPFGNLYASYPLEFGPAGRGSASNKAYALGGNDPLTWLNQDISNLGRSPADIDSGQLQFSFSGWVGGHSNQEDFADVKVEFFNQSMQLLGGSTLQKVSAAQRKNRTRMFLLQNFGTVPPLTRSARVTVNFNRTIGTINNGMVDDLSLSIFGQPATTVGSFTAPGYTGDPTQLQGTAVLQEPYTNRIVLETPIKFNSDGTFSFTATVPSGTYDVKAGTTNSIRQVVPGVTFVTGTSVSLPIQITLGDINQDNYIGTDDYLALSASFDLAPEELNFDSRADLNGDGEVGTDDYLILNENFDISGD